MTPAAHAQTAQTVVPPAAGLTGAFVRLAPAVTLPMAVSSGIKTAAASKAGPTVLERRRRRNGRRDQRG